MRSIKYLHDGPEPNCEITCGPCAMCNKVTTLVLPTDEVIRWRAGEHIQKVWPDMPTMKRETLISGVCSQQCWDLLWKE